MTTATPATPVATSRLTAHPLPTSPLTNLRHLGGIAVDGGTVRDAVLFRADDVSLVDEAGAVALVEDGVRLIIDLRSPEEAARTGRGVLAGHPVEYLHLPLTDEVADPTSLSLFAELMQAPDPERAMGGWYAGLLRDRAGDIVRGLAAVADADGGVVFHCAAGKDRTGVFAATVLTILGADRADIVADYARTADNLPALLGRLATGRPELAKYADLMPKAPHVLMSAPAATMDAMLDEFARGEGLVAVLAAAGLTDDLVARLREKLVA